MGEVRSLEHGNCFPEALATHWAGLDKPQQLIVASVAGGEVFLQLQAFARKLWNIRPERLVAKRSHKGLVNCYEHPQRLGIDRWLAMIGARELAPGAVCVVDAGTAMTIDVADAPGKHLGGLILPGLALMSGSLQTGTAIPEYSEQPSGNLLGCSTVNAIALGSVQALGSLVDRVVTQAGIEELRLLLTGGDAQLLASVIEYPVEQVPHLVFHGLMTFIETD